MSLTFLAHQVSVASLVSPPPMLWEEDWAHVAQAFFSASLLNLSLFQTHEGDRDVTWSRMSGGGVT